MIAQEAKPWPMCFHNSDMKSGPKLRQEERALVTASASAYPTASAKI
jgi:hypothetical protein